MPRTRTGTVYALIDPRNNKIRYVGKTTQPILARLGGHVANPTNPAMRVWINSLGLQGLVPRIEVVTTTTEAKLDAEEQLQIRRHAREGHRLLNSPYYKENLGDLSQPATAPEPTALPPQPRPSYDREMERQIFGRLAQARAEGRVSAWVVVLLVVAGGPVYGVLVFLRGLLCLKVVRALVAVFLCGLPFWESGFDRAVRDLVLARLPLHEGVLLWGTYFAGPLDTLAMSLMWPFLIASVWMAGVTYSCFADA